MVDGVFEGLHRDVADASPLKESGVWIQDNDILEDCGCEDVCLEICWIGDGPGLVLVADFLKRIIHG